MLIKGCNVEDFSNYKQPSMFIIFPYCDFKCDKENGDQYCQNWSLSLRPGIDISIESLVNQYISNPITKAIVCGGLEPINSWNDLLELIQELRKYTSDDIVIYTGYTEEEIADKVEILKGYKNIVMKFGRYRPNQEKHYDEVLGISLASDNQYGKRIN